MCTHVSGLYGASEYRISGSSVWKERSFEAIRGVVAEKLQQYTTPRKINIYSGSVDQTKEIRKVLEYPIYHRDVDSWQEKHNG